ncbi:hypothetical protein GGS24DRAFT_500482 [Hypoxylon argillaceum]|nr:hypothetical protein GGS24DRAFT_500482 [Hypoxylon argillaceum]
MATNPRVEASAEELRNGFSDAKNWEFEKFLGHGSYGVVLVRGCSHIARMIAYCEDVNDVNQLQQSLQSRAPDIVNIVRRWFRPPVGTVFDVLGQSRIQGPAILLEYLENGTLLRFLERARGKKKVVRACVGMAWPPDEFPPVLETVPEDRAPTRLRHRDIAFRNVMIGDRDPAGPFEHRVIPQLKLIDFGKMRDGPSAKFAMADNVKEAAGVMVHLISLNEEVEWGVVNYHGVHTEATPLVVRRGARDPFPQLDSNLRDLLILCMARDLNEVPPLEILLREVEKGMRKRPSAYGDRESEEEDEVIQASRAGLERNPLVADSIGPDIPRVDSYTSPLGALSLSELDGEEPCLDFAESVAINVRPREVVVQTTHVNGAPLGSKLL